MADPGPFGGAERQPLLTAGSPIPPRAGGPGALESGHAVNGSGEPLGGGGAAGGPAAAGSSSPARSRRQPAHGDPDDDDDDGYDTAVKREQARGDTFDDSRTSHRHGFGLTLGRRRPPRSPSATLDDDSEAAERRRASRWEKGIHTAEEEFARAWHDTAHVHSHVHSLTEAEKARMAAYESLDYDLVQNLVYQRERAFLDPASSRTSLLRWLIFAFAGIITGVLAFGMAVMTTKLAGWKLDQVYDPVKSGYLVRPYFIYTGISMAYVFVATFLVSVVEPAAAGSGIPEVKGYLNGTNYLRILRMKTLIVKALGVCFSVAGGLSVGKEGPLVHTGSVVAANLSHATGFKSVLVCKNPWWRRTFLRFRNDRDKRDFVSGGAAAGVSAAFGAPVGGILFSLEEAASFWSVNLTWNVFLCSMLSAFSLNLCKLALNDSSIYSGLISFGPALSGNAFRVWELPVFILIGVLGGLAGALFNAINFRLSRWRRDNLQGRTVIRITEALCVAALTAAVSFWIPYLWSTCTVIPAADLKLMKELGQNFYVPYQCPEGEFNSLASLMFTTAETSIRGIFHNTGHYDYVSLVIFTILIYILSVITYGIAVPSGLFVPSILMGCGFGRLLGELMRDLFPDAGIIPGTYAVIGATAMLGGVSRMTISLTVIILETTNDIQFITPIMITLMVAKWVGDWFNISVYDIHVELKCMPFVESAPTASMYHLQAVDIMSSPVITFFETETVATVLRVLGSCGHNGFPIVTAEAPHRFVGMVTRNQLAVVINHRAFGDASKALNQVSFVDFATSLQSQKQGLSTKHLTGNDMLAEIHMRVWMNPVPVSVQEGCPLTRVYTLFRSLGIRHLVVTDSGNQVSGIITRKEIMSSFNQDLS